MKSLNYRPWGQFLWIVDNLNFSHWDLIGCLSTEDRSTTVYSELRNKNLLNNCYIFKIEDPILAGDPMSPLAERIINKHNKIYGVFRGLGLSDDDIFEYRLFEYRDVLISALDEISNSTCGNLVFDISTFPKRFFFPIIKILLEDDNIENLIIAYTVPEMYERGEMAEDYEEWRTLPFFGEKFPPRKSEIIFAGAGHMAMGLPEQIEDVAGGVDIRVFMPFPGDPHSFNRNWDFIRNIENNLNPGRIHICTVYARDVPEVFDYLTVESNYGKKEALLAPYGPKPISLAMCLFACITGSPVYYTQPRVYSPEYSSGVKVVDNNPQIFTYCIKINKNTIYSLKDSDD